MSGSTGIQSTCKKDSLFPNANNLKMNETLKKFNQKADSQRGNNFNKKKFSLKSIIKGNKDEKFDFPEKKFTLEENYNEKDFPNKINNSGIKTNKNFLEIPNENEINDNFLNSHSPTLSDSNRTTNTLPNSISQVKNIKSILKKNNSVSKLKKVTIDQYILPSCMKIDGLSDINKNVKKILIFYFFS